MANKKISDLPLGTATGTTLIPVMNAGVTQRIALSQIDEAQLITWANVAEKPTFATVSTSGDYNDLSNQPTLFSGSYNDLTGKPTIPADVSDLTDNSNLLGVGPYVSKLLWVATNGDDATADGSAYKPYATVQAAHDFAAGEFAVGDDVVILLAPGAYAGFTVTRPRTHIMGFAGLSNATRVNGTVTINPSSVVGGVYNSLFTLDNLLLTPNSGNALVITGNQRLNFIGKTLKMYTDSPGQTCVLCDNTSSGGVRMFFYDSDIQSELTNAITVNISNVFAGALKRVNLYGGTNYALRTVGSVVTLDNVFASCNFTDVVSITGTSTMTAGNSTFNNAQANSNGVNVASGSTAVIGQCAFDVPAGTGYAVKGVAGSVFVYANNIIAYGKNNRISSAMTSVPMGTSFTAVA